MVLESTAVLGGRQMVLEYSSTLGEADGTGVQPSSDLGGSSLESRPRIAYPCMSRSRNKNRALVS